MRAIALIFVVALPIGCNAALGIGDYTFDGAGGATGSTTSGASAGGSAASSGSMTTTASTSSGAGSEDCSNGVDDDGDGDIDCADSDCGAAGYTCAAAVPAGWVGPIVRSSAGVVPAPCGGGFPDAIVKGGASLDAKPATCTACACAQSADEVCSLPKVTLWDDVNCTGTSETHTPMAVGSCASLDSVDTVSVKIVGATAVSGTCAASGGAPSGAGAGWQQAATACGNAVTGKGCSDGGACRPSSPPGYGAEACITHAGDVACPPAYPAKALVYTTIDDTRTCTPCACGGAQGGCSPQTSLYTGFSCNTAAITVANDGQCHTLAHLIADSMKAAPPVVGGTCPPSGGVPMGSTTAATPETICCEQ
jgi:hypothetical protein